jgi:hypothetical protein
VVTTIYVFGPALIPGPAEGSPLTAGEIHEVLSERHVFSAGRVPSVSDFVVAGFDVISGTVLLPRGARVVGLCVEVNPAMFAEEVVVEHVATVSVWRAGRE